MNRMCTSTGVADVTLRICASAVVRQLHICFLSVAPLACVHILSNCVYYCYHAAAIATAAVVRMLSFG
jgi:hypothetical protein